jgi:hypothetical protein
MRWPLRGSYLLSVRSTAPLYSTALKEEAKAVARGLKVVDGDPVLVKLMDKYVGKVLV